MEEQVQNGEPKLEERILLIKRVSKKTTGGNYITFTCLVVVGDKKGRVGVGFGRSQEIPPAIKKAIIRAKKNMIDVPIFKSSIPHDVQTKFKAAKVILKPAPAGTGLKVGSVMRAILELAGIKDASGKILGSRNQTVNTYAIVEALKKLRPKVS